MVTEVVGVVEVVHGGQGQSGHDSVSWGDELSGRTCQGDSGVTGEGKGGKPRVVSCKAGGGTWRRREQAWDESRLCVYSPLALRFFCRLTDCPAPSSQDRNSTLARDSALWTELSEDSSYLLRAH